MVPTQLAALAAGVTEATIRKWASRAKISRYGSPGRAEYDVGELIEVAAARHDRHVTRDVQAVRPQQNEAADDAAVGPQRQPGGR
jgi:hypothetical protein